MIKIKKVADLKRNYTISTSKLKIAHWSILGFSTCIMLTIIANIRAPDLIKIPLFILAGFVIYKSHRQLKYFRYHLDYYLIIRESLLYVLYTNRLYTAQKIVQS